ncbi:HIT family protein [Candidatus Pacearchaeota archaeon]|nr:HIT family protein [Candidatus Pacearchaeota archaeon]
MKCIFCEFISGKSENHQWKKQYPLIPIFKTKKIYSFLSNPDYNGETHLLIIPKKHYEFLEQVPKKLLNELMSEITYAAGILRKKYGACHVLLNNGEGADQYIPHVHFHIIPKNKNKKIIWKNLDLKQFKKISENLKKEFKSKN